MQVVSSSVLSSKSGKLPQSNTLTPGEKEVRRQRREEERNTTIFGL